MKSAFERFNDWLRNSITIKLIAVAFLTLLLLIPTEMITSIIRDRQNTHDEATQEVSGKWGYSQTLAGPVLNIPYKIYSKKEDGTLVETMDYAHFLPGQLTVTGSIVPEIRYRGFYKVAVYKSNLAFKGFFDQPDVKALGISPNDVSWNEAFVTVGIPDLRGIQDRVDLMLNGKKYAFDPGVETKDLFESGIRAPIVLKDSLSGNMTFEFNIALNGSGELNFIPLGKETDITIQSSWNNPSFNGAFLPDERNITSDGFTANWKILHLNRNYPQQWKGNAYGIDDSAFGVQLLIPVDEYQKTMRAVKYAILMIALTFVLFFFVEVLNKKPIHPMQYILSGLAICLFYSLLLAFSKHIGFNYAYLVAAIAIITMLTVYCGSIFLNRRLTVITGLLMILLYGFMFVLIQLQDFALLIGSIGLFFLLALIMYLSRKIKWYGDSETSG